MTCGSKTCSSVHPIDHVRGFDVRSCTSWLSNFFARIVLIVERAWPARTQN
jgi:hypothetical protein